MIGKVLRGERPAGLIYYLYGPGKHEEHTDPHIVAGWRDPAELEPPLRPGGRRDFRQLNGLLQQTVAALGDRHRAGRCGIAWPALLQVTGCYRMRNGRRSPRR